MRRHARPVQAQRGRAAGARGSGRHGRRCLLSRPAGACRSHQGRPAALPARCQARWASRVAAYGAAAKGNTLLNFAGVRPDLLPYVVDASPHKQGRFLPGSRIPVHAPQQLLRDRPDFVLILPWNLREEIAAQLGPCAPGPAASSLPCLSCVVAKPRAEAEGCAGPSRCDGARRLIAGRVRRSIRHRVAAYRFFQVPSAWHT